METSTAPREILLMNNGWHFHLGDLEERNFDCITREHYQAAEWLKAGNQGVAKVGYPDDDWRSVNLPHDWVIEGEFTPQANLDHGSLPVGVAWYRKTFELPASDAGRRISLEFDGIYRNCTAWLNGHYLGNHLSGYTSFQFDITDVCNFGGYNALAVRVDASEFELWSYEGGGIYRDVRLVKTHPIHTGYCGVFVKVTPPTTTRSSARLAIETRLNNDTFHDAECVLLSEVFDADGACVTTVRSTSTLSSNSAKTLIHKTSIKCPRLWDLDSPHLYRLRITVLIDSQIVDRCETCFGIRSIRFDPEKSFFINGRPLKLQGVCCHQDHAGVGVAVPRRLQEWRILKLKEMGANALRTSHNPPDPALLEACDRLGMLVMDENRLIGTSPEILGQLESLVCRDRNHPSVILWSLGNEEMNVQHTDIGIRLLRRMQDLVHRLDPTRPVTYAMNVDWYNIADLHDRAGFRIDVMGGNYVFNKGYDVDSRYYDDFHRKHPDWPLVASESGGSLSTRGLYEPEITDPPLQPDPGVVWSNPKRTGIVSAYGETFTPWGYSIEQTWKDCASRPFHSGTFLWTGFDYRGEIYPYSWPAVVARFGIMDLCGFPKDAWYYYRAWWRNEPILHLFPHWTWPGKEGQVIDVWCYTNCARVELFLNGHSLGMQTMEINGHLEWRALYAPGRLEALGYDQKGNQILTTFIETTSALARLLLSPDRLTFNADGEDVVVVNVAVLDAQDHLVSSADNEVRFSVEGPARILGVGNGNPISHEPDKANRREAYHGLCQVLLQATRSPGPVRLTACAEGLESAVMELQALEAITRPFVP
jgi:beta-galactosidase